MNYAPRRIAFVAFFVGLLPVILTPVALLFGYHHILEFIGIIYQDELGSKFNVGFGSILYLMSLPVWFGYAWAASSKRTEAELRSFWITSAGINAMWVFFFIITMLRPDKATAPLPVWIAYTLFPLVLLPMSMMGIQAAAKQRKHDEQA